jgi:hypothetical protein
MMMMMNWILKKGFKSKPVIVWQISRIIIRYIRDLDKDDSKDTSKISSEIQFSR